MGSVSPRKAATTYWAGANAGILFSEFLTDVGSLPSSGAFYIFLNPKIENNHGGPGRAVAVASDRASSPHPSEPIGAAPVVRHFCRPR